MTIPTLLAEILEAKRLKEAAMKAVGFGIPLPLTREQAAYLSHARNNRVEEIALAALEVCEAARGLQGLTYGSGAMCVAEENITRAFIALESLADEGKKEEAK